MSCRRTMATLVLVVLGTLVKLNIAVAGGWAVITLDKLPGELFAGAESQLGFRVLQHGQHGLAGLTPQVTFWENSGALELVLQASPSGEAGHYIVTVEFPRPGTWEWQIAAFTMVQPMPALDVGPPTVSIPTPSPEPARWPFGLLLLGLLGAMIAAMTSSRRSPAWTAGLIALAFLAGASGLAVADLEGPAAYAGSPAQVSALPPAELGAALFLAKGCNACHDHAEIGASLIKLGPDLTDYKRDAAFIRLWLENPAGIKPDTMMPDLNLEPEEIKALTAFLNS